MLEKLALGMKGVDLVRAGVGLAVSGGADSVALAAAFVELAAMKGLKSRVEILHVNHGLRSGASGADQRFARALARRLGLGFRSQRVRVKRRRDGLASEEAARNARYEALLSMARRGRLRYILTAHTADDQAETVLLNIARGAGLVGLSGMPARRVLSRRPLIELIRPMLAITRQEVLSFLRARKLSWRQDASNLALDYTRNRVRRVVLPAIKKHLNPRAAEHLVALARTAGAAHSFIATQAAGLLEKKPGGAVRLRVKALERASDAVAREAVRQAAETVSAGSSAIGAERVEAVLGLLAARGSARFVELSSGAVARREYGDLVFLKGKGIFNFLKKRGQKAESSPSLEALPLNPSREGRGHKSEVVFGRWRISAALRSGASFDIEKFLRTRRGWSEAFDASQVKFPLVVRRRNAGDRIAIGKGSSKKLKDVLAEARLPARERDAVPIVADSGGNILLVVPLRRAFFARVNPDTKRVLILSARASR